MAFLVLNSWKWEAWMLMGDLAILAVDAFIEETLFVEPNTFVRSLEQNGIQKTLETTEKARVS